MAITFSTFSTFEGLQELDTYLLTRSYITGYQASKDDLAVFVALTSAPGSSTPNAARWYNHISFLLAQNFVGEAQGVSVGSQVSAPAPAIVSKEVEVPEIPAAAEPESAPAAPATAAAEEEDDDDVDDLFADPTEEEKAAQAARAADAAKKGKKKAVGKSSILLDIKPWDDETDMVKLEASVRAIHKEGLTWGASRLVPVGYGIKKLTMMMTIVDDLVSVDDLIENYLTLEGSECGEHIQSCDIAAFNKI